VVLADEDLAAVLQSLVGGDVARLEGAPTPLFLREDWEQVLGSMPVFNGDGPMPVEAPEDLVDVSSNDSSEQKEEGEQEEGVDSEAESRAPPLRRRSRTLRLPQSDDDEDKDEQGDGSLPPIPKKDRTGLIPRGSAPAPRRSTGAPPAPELLEVDPSSLLLGFKYCRRLLEPARDDL